VSEASAASALDLIARLKAMPVEKRLAALDAAHEEEVRLLDAHWPCWAHGGQLPPHDQWTVWVMLAGRGFGKTRAGAEWVSARARENGQARIALVAANPQEARRVMIEGRGGLFAAAQDGEERRAMCWEPGLGRLTFASGAQAFVYSGADGESLRGPEHHFAWCDELPKWRRAQESWDNLMLGLRAGARPQVVVTTTPRAGPALRAVLEIEGVVLTGGASRDNPHLPAAFIEAVERFHLGTRLGRQELLGELIEDVHGSLWPRRLIDRCRVEAFAPGEGPGSARERMRRIVVGVDPPVSAEGDECGIVVCGVGPDGTGYVLADHSAGGLSPEGWALRVAGAAERWGADRIVAEGNQGGEMVEAVLRGAGIRIGVRRVHARVGKVRRAEPVAAFFESGEAKLAGCFDTLEEQMTGLVLGGDYMGKGRSPDRADAMVWAMTELMLGPVAPVPRIRSL
jgi:phage terminase large subunit-like protein